MSAATPDLERPQARADAGPPPPRMPRRGRIVLWAAVTLGTLVVLLAVLAGGARLVVRTQTGRDLVARVLEGLPLGAVGRLHVEGVAGDPLTDLRLARLQIVDAQGPWLDARDLEMRWRWSELLSRRFHAQAITARTLTILRNPVLKPQPPSRGESRLPVAVQIDALRLRLETAPAFSVRHGLYDVDGRFALERNMAAQGRLAAVSRLHAGDGLSADFRVGQGGRVAIRADASEGPGGALAGALGLPVDRPLTLRLRADGTVDRGDLQLRTAVGADAPLTADAAWGAAGARLTARLELGASRLTRDLAPRAGPLADLDLIARHLHGDTFQTQGALSTQTASLAISGPLDWKVRSTSGLTLALKVPDAARWAPGVQIGSATLGGVVSGDPERFDFKGRLEAFRLAQGGYGLATASGPVSLSRREAVWRVQGDLAGAGGAGQGLLPGLLGRTPNVQLDLTRLADGRLLLNRLDAKTPALTLSGQGGQGLLGDLSFKGQAQLASLGSVQKGARGRLDASWSATQPKSVKDWRFTLDARGAGIGTGVPVADHFLGAAPSLKVDAAWGAGGLQVASASLAGAAAQATGHGRLDPEGALAFDLGWAANGPFDAGPLHVAGQANGTAKLGGSVSAPTVAVDSRLASVALGRLLVVPAQVELTLAPVHGGVAGQVALAGPSAYGPASIKAAFQSDGQGVAVHDLAADAGGVKASGSLALRSGAPAAADLVVQVRPGAFIDAGKLDGTVRLADGPAGLAAHLALEGQGIVAPGVQGTLRQVKLRADGPFDHLPMQLSVDGTAPIPFSFAGSGRLDQAASARQLTLEGSGQVRRIGYRTLRPAVLKLGDDARELNLGLAVGGGRAEVEARQGADTLNASAHLTGVDLATLDPDYAGAVNATLSLAGRGPTLGGALDATLAGARSRDATANLALDGHVHADLAGERLRLTAAATNAQGLKSNLDVDLPAVATAAPFRIAIDRTRPMRGDFAADGELRPLWDLLVGGDQRLSGHVSAHGALAGSLNAPQFTGHAQVADGRYQNFAVGLDLQKFAAHADFSPDLVRVVQVSGSDGRGGSLSGSGDMSLAKGGASDFKLALQRFRVIDTDTATATMSGAITVTRDAKGQAKLAGALKVDRADIQPNTPTPSGVVDMDVVEINKPGEVNPDLSAPQRPASVEPPVVLDVTVRASRGVFVKGKGLNVELSLDAHVGGSAGAPALSGDAKVVLGSYDFAGKRFDFDPTSVVHLGSTPEDIRLNLTAKRQDATLDAEVHVTGTAARPDIKLTSIPVLPQDEVLSQVLFGSSAAQLTGSQAAELASTLASLSGGGGFDVLGRLRQFAGLDRLAFGQGESGTGVSGGKYVSDDVYVELTGGGREGPSAAVEWRVRKNFSVISRVGTQGDAQLSIQYNRTFK